MDHSQNLHIAIVVEFIDNSKTGQSPIRTHKGKAGRTVKLTLCRERNGPLLEREVAFEAGKIADAQ